MPATSLAVPGWAVRVVSPVDGPLRARFAEAGAPVDFVDASAVLAARDRRGICLRRSIASRSSRPGPAPM